MPRHRHARAWVLALFSLIAMGQSSSIGGGSFFADLERKLVASANLAPGQKLLIASTAFIDAETKRPPESGPALLLIQEFERHLHDLQNKLSLVEIRTPGKTLPSGDNSTRRLNDIFWDPNSSSQQKVEKIVSGIMTPSGIDVLIFGQYQERANGSIVFRPILVSKAAKTYSTESRTFDAKDLTCNAGNGPQQVICPKASQEILELLLRLFITL